MENQVPAWVRRLAKVYFTRTISQFILHGNISDYVSVPIGEKEYKYERLKDYLANELFKKRDIVVMYDRAAGITFREPAMRKDFIQALGAYDTFHGTQYAQRLPKEPTEAFAILENYFRNRLINDNKRIAFIIDYAETLVPMGSSNFYSVQDRAILVYLQKWAKEHLFLQKDMTIILLTENLNDLNQQLVRSPFTYDIEIPYPNETERLAFIEHTLKAAPQLEQLLEMSPQVLAKNTAGMNLIHLKTMLAEVQESKEFFTFEALKQRKKDTIESEAGGLLEFVETKYTLDNVAGHKAAKNHLRAAAAAIKKGRNDVMPMGYLVNGPVGTGKTYLVSCFAAEIGIPMVQLKNFRSQWQGVTEANLEKVLKILSAMNPVAVMIDEADAYLGNRNMQGDSGVSNRVFSMIASFMSNTEHRGKIIWFLLTARPDLMPVDLKRQGRAEEHIALFYPETIEEKKELLEVMLKKTKILNIQIEDFPPEFLENMPIRSGADMEAALTRAKFKAASLGLAEVTIEIIQQAFDDFIPPTYPEEVELMNYVAVLECTSKELLPERFRDMRREDILARIEEIKRKMQGRI
ncbi:MAG: AAA family ATPase [Bacteroidia bacterium]|nr:AAA family ATPase [Bacteroidia bacterium]MDW8157604.1 AAA family ATPase [Bacteroidia bacterium]